MLCWLQQTVIAFLKIRICHGAVMQRHWKYSLERCFVSFQYQVSQLGTTNESWEAQLWKAIPYPLNHNRGGCLEGVCCLPRKMTFCSQIFPWHGFWPVASLENVCRKREAVCWLIITPQNQLSSTAASLVSRFSTWVILGSVWLTSITVAQMEFK